MHYKSLDERITRIIMALETFHPLEAVTAAHALMSLAIDAQHSLHQYPQSDACRKKYGQAPYNYDTMFRQIGDAVDHALTEFRQEYRKRREFKPLGKSATGVRNAVEDVLADALRVEAYTEFLKAHGKDLFPWPEDPRRTQREAVAQVRAVVGEMAREFGASKRVAQQIETIAEAWYKASLKVKDKKAPWYASPAGQ